MQSALYAEKAIANRVTMAVGHSGGRTFWRTVRGTRGLSESSGNAIERRRSRALKLVANVLGVKQTAMKATEVGIGVRLIHAEKFKVGK